MTVLDRVSAEGVRARRFAAVAAVAAGAACVLALLSVGVLILGRGQWIDLPLWAPFAWWLVVGAMVVWAARRLPRELTARTTDEAVALQAEGERGLRAGSLVGLVQVAPSGGALIGLQINHVGAIVGDGSLAPRHGQRLAFAAMFTISAALFSGILTWSIASHRADGLRALLHPWAAARGSLLDSLSLAQTPASVLRGDSLTAIVDAAGRRHVRLAWRVTGRGEHDTTLAVKDGRAMLALGVVDAPIMLVASDSRTTSDSLSVSVFERPFAGDVAVRAVYPDYLGRSPEVLAPDDALRLPEGTTLEVMARAAGLSSIALVDSRDSVPLSISAGRARGRIVARTSGTWRWSSPVAGADLPAALVVDVVPDSAPLIEIIAPSRDTLVSPSDAIRLTVAAVDDHALQSVRLRTWAERAGGARDPERVTELNDVSGARWMGKLDFDLTSAKLHPGDAMIVVAEARDHAPWGRVGTSRRLELRVPTADARRDAAMQAADSAVARAAAASAAQRALQKKTTDAARTSANRADPKNAGTNGSSRDGAASFDAQERAREVAADQKAMGDRLQELSKQADDLAKALQQAGVMDSSISAELREAQRLLKEAMTPELQQQLKDLEAQRQTMTGDELKDALSKMQQPQENVRDALDKAHEMLKRAALEGSMQSMSDAAKDLAQQQRQFGDSSAKQTPASAKDLADRAKALQDDIKKLEDRLQKDQANAAKPGVQKAADDAAQSAKKMQDAMQKAMEQLGLQTPQQQSGDQQQQQNGQQSGQQGGRGGTQQAGQQAGQQQGQRGSPQGQQGQGQQGQQSQQGAQQSAQQAADAMQQASDAVGQARQAQVNAWKQEITDAIDRSIQESLQMARQQDQISAQARDGATAQTRAEQGALQQGVQQTADRLAQQGQKSALISPSSQRAMDAAKQNVEQATRDLSDPMTSSQAQRSMQDAANALRQAAASLARDRERAGNSETASGLPEMMQQMREVATQQGQLNGQTASMLPSPGQNVGPGTARDEAMKQIAEKQRQLAKKLDDAADADPTGRADAMAREAREIAQQLDRGAIDPSVIDRQQRLFGRMLDAGRTLEQDQRDDSNHREAKSGQGITGNAPATGTSSGAAASKFKEPTWDELRGLTAEERRLVIEYFRRLNGKQQ